MVDLEKIQSVVETEVTKAIAAERKRIITIIGDMHKELVSAIKGDDEPPAKKAPVKPKATKPAKPKPEPKATKPAKPKPEPKATKPAKPKPEPQEEEEEEVGTAAPGDYDISEVGDDEVEDSPYNDHTLTELRTVCSGRNIEIPKGYKKPEIIKLLILVDEEEES